VWVLRTGGPGPELVIEGKQTHLTWPVLKDLEGRDRSDRRPPARLPRQVQNVDEAFRLSAEIHEQADHPGSRYAGDPACDLLANREPRSAGVQLDRRTNLACRPG
jgi:hypothetical protein